MISPQSTRSTRRRNRKALSFFGGEPKICAHATTLESRTTIDKDAINIRWGHLKDAQETICKVANFISVYLLNTGSFFSLPVPQFNPLEYLEYIERPLVNSSDFFLPPSCLRAFRVLRGEDLFRIRARRAVSLPKVE
jgi:hypothetical protein